MKVSIIVPCYNVENYLRACLSSVEKQTHDDIELIIVDDCSTDSTLKIAHAFVERNKHNSNLDINLIEFPHNKGVSEARNTGIKVSTGEYLYFLDSDDEITPDCIEKLVKPLYKKRYDIVIGDFKRNIKRELEWEEKWRLNLKEGEWQPNSKIFHEYCRQNIYVMPWNKLCRREFIFDNELFFVPGIRHEDVVWGLSVFLNIESMYVVNNVTYLYMIRPTSFTIVEQPIGITKSYCVLYPIVNKVFQKNRPHRKIDVWHYYDDLYNLHYISCIFYDWEKEYLEMRRTDVRPYGYIFLKSISSLRFLKSFGHLLLPPHIAFKVYRHIITHWLNK